MDETFCSCCGRSSLIYEIVGHDKECIGYEDHMIELAEKWAAEKPVIITRYNRSVAKEWKLRYDLIVPFLLDAFKIRKKNQVQID